MLGISLKTLRKERGLSQVELATAVGIDQRYLSDLERGARTNPSREVILSLANALNVPITTLAEATWAHTTLPAAPIEPANALLQELTAKWADLSHEEQVLILTIVRSVWERRQ